MVGSRAIRALEDGSIVSAFDAVFDHLIKITVDDLVAVDLRNGFTIFTLL